MRTFEQILNAEKMKIAIRVDASTQIGTGHVIRCLTLAEALKTKAVEILFICREHQGNVITFLHEKGFEVSALPLEKQEDYFSTPHAEWLGADWETDSQRVINILQDRPSFRLVLLNLFSIASL